MLAYCVSKCCQKGEKLVFATSMVTLCSHACSHQLFSWHLLLPTLQHWCISKHYPNQGIDASGPLKVRTPFGGSVYFNNPNSNYAPIDCELGTSGQLDCQVQGKFCYYDRDMLTCNTRGLYPGSSGYGLILGSNGLNLTPVQLAAQPQPSEP